jgi:hypothetical protein
MCAELKSVENRPPRAIFWLFSSYLRLLNPFENTIRMTASSFANKFLDKVILLNLKI